jgi:predicted nucleic acid-binding protein
MNQRPWFVDTGHWLALADSGDRYHERARELAANVRGRLVTTDAVLIEVGNALSTSRWRALGVALLADVRASSDVDIVALTPELMGRAIEFYSSRTDKEWGLTDCISFVVMEERGITEALAADQHFVQAGYQALLREV